MAGDAPTGTPFDAVRRRLELGLAALYGRAFTIETAAAPARAAWHARLLRRAPVAARTPLAPPSTDGVVIRLPAALDDAGDAPALARLRALALVQAERALRGAGAHAPAPTDDATRLAHDLYACWDGRAALRAARARAAGLAPAFDALRTLAHDARPDGARLTAIERDVESLVRIALDDASHALPPAWPDDDASPAAALAWAHAQAAALRGSARARYRGLAPVLAWGSLDAWLAAAPDPALPTTPRAGEERTLPPSRLFAPPSPRGRRARRSRDGEAPHRQVGAPDRPPEDVDAPDALDDPRGRLVAERGTSGTGRGSGDVRALRGEREHEAPARSVAHEYPEWDARTRTLVPRAVRVLVPPPDWRGDGGARWVATTLRTQGATVRAVRARFEKLRPKRERLPAQRDGAELDLDACVRLLVERRTGAPPTDRTYVAIRPARRPIAIAVLVDTSGSTDAWVDDARQVIDVEREAVLLAAEALDALGDPFTLLAFSSYGARHVEVESLKTFAEPHGPRVRARIGALAAGGNTRLGGALRHATALLARQPAGHRLLLLVTDGRPNDADGYTGAAALDDARQAVLEARATGIVPFCLAVGNEEPDYLPTLFGAAGYAMLRDPARLPTALLGAVRSLLAR